MKKTAVLIVVLIFAAQQAFCVDIRFGPQNKRSGFRFNEAAAGAQLDASLSQLSPYGKYEKPLDTFDSNENPNAGWSTAGAVLIGLGVLPLVLGATFWIMGATSTESYDTKLKDPGMYLTIGGASAIAVGGIILAISY